MRYTCGLQAYFWSEYNSPRRIKNMENTWAGTDLCPEKKHDIGLDFPYTCVYIHIDVTYTYIHIQHTYQKSSLKHWEIPLPHHTIWGEIWLFSTSEEKLWDQTHSCHSIHGENGIFPYVYHHLPSKSTIHVGKYTVFTMDGISKKILTTHFFGWCIPEGFTASPPPPLKSHHRITFSGAKKWHSLKLQVYPWKKVWNCPTSHTNRLPSNHPFSGAKIVLVSRGGGYPQ